MSIKEIKKFNGLVSKTVKTAPSKAASLSVNKKKHEAETDPLQADAAQQAPANAAENVADMAVDLTTQATPNGDSPQTAPAWVSDLQTRTEGLLPQSLSGETSAADLSQLSALSSTEITSPLHGTQWAQAATATATDAGEAAAAASTHSPLLALAAFTGVVAAAAVGGTAAPVVLDTIIKGVLVAGPVITGHGLTVKVYDLAGNLLKSGAVGTDGSYTINLGSYTGGVILKVIDDDSGANDNDFRDEATGVDKDLNATFMAVDVVSTAGQTLTLNLNTATTAAAVKAGLSATNGLNTDTGTVTVTGAATADKIATIQAANAAVAKVLGITTGTLTGTVATAVVNPDGTPNTKANAFGKLLAAFSGQDETNGGNMATTITNFVAGIEGTGTSVTLSSAAQAALITSAASAGVSAKEVATILSPTAATSATELAKLTTEQAAALTPTVAAYLAGEQLTNLTNLNGIPPASLKAISPAALKDAFAANPALLTSLNETQIAALDHNGTNSAFADLSAAQITALDTDISALSATTVGNLNADQLGALSAAQIGALGGNPSATPPVASKLTALTADDILALGTDIAGLSAEQITALETATPGLFDKLSAAQIEALGTKVAALSAAALGAWDAAQLGALSAAQIGVLGGNPSATPPVASKLTALTATDITNLGPDITGLSAAQIAALSDTQIGGLSDTQANQLATASKLALLNAAQIIAMQPQAIDSVPAEVIAAQLSAQQFADLSVDQLANLSKLQITALADANKLTSLDANDIKAIDTNITGLSAPQLANLNTTQLEALTPNQINALATDGDLAQLTGTKLQALGTDIQAITADQLKAFTTTQLNDLSSEQVGALASANKLTGLAANQIGALQNDITALTAAQVNALSATQLGGITTDQADALKASGDFNNLSAASIKALSAEAIDSVPASRFTNTNLSAADVAALSQAQVQMLTAEQLAALNTAGYLDNLSWPLTGAQILALGANLTPNFAGIDTADEIALFNQALHANPSNTGALNLADIASGVQALTGAVGGGALTVANLTALGLTGVNDNNIAAIKARIDATSASTDTSLVNSLAELKAIVANASGEFGGTGTQAAGSRAELADGTTIAVAIPTDITSATGNQVLRLHIPGTSGGADQTIDYTLTADDITRGYANIPLSLAQAEAAGNGVKAVTFDVLVGGTATASGIAAGDFDIELASLTANSFSPVANTTHSIDRDLTITFDKAISKGTGTISLYKADGTLVESFNVATSTALSGWDSTTLSINPSANLTTGEAYYVKADPTAIADSLGNTWAGINNATTWHFTGTRISVDLTAISGDNRINSAENTAVIALGGTLSADPAAADLIALFTNGDFTITLTATDQTTVTATVTSFTTSTGAWAATVPANTLVDGVTYTVTVMVDGHATSTNNAHAVTTGTLKVDLSAATATVVAADIQSTASATVQSTETGCAYLVKDGETFTTVAQLDALANTDLANKVAILNPGTNTVLSAAGLVEGNYHLYVSDDAGNISLASANTVTVDNSKPTASLTASIIKPSASATVQSTEAGTAYLVANSITVNNLGSITTAADNAWNSVAILTANQATQLAATGLADGVYKLYTVDKAGNLSVASTQTITIDNTAPTLTDAGISISGATGNGSIYIAGDTVTAVVAPSDANMVAGQGSVTVDFSAWGGGATVAATYQTTGANTGKWVATYAITEGAGTTAFNSVVKNINATATDAADNTTTTADTTGATVDNVDPTAVLTTGITNTPASFNAVVKSDTANAMAYLVKTTVTDFTRANLAALAVPGTQAKTVTISAANTNTNLPTSGLDDGDYKLYVVDAAGNVSSASANIVTIDTKAPTLAINSGMGDGITAGELANVGTVTGRVGEAVTVTLTSGANIVTKALTLTDNGQGVGTAIINLNDATDLTGTVANLATSPVSISVADVAGNSYVAPVLGLTGNSTLADSTVNFAEKTAGVTLTGNTAAGSTVTVGYDNSGDGDSLDAGETLGTATVTGTTWSYALTPDNYTTLGQGTKNLIITGVGAAGAASQSATAKQSIFIDTVGPAIAPTVNTSSTIIYRDAAHATITGTWDNTNADGQGTYTLQSVTINNVIYTSANGLTSNPNGTWSLTHANIPALAVGTYHVTVTEADALGNATSYTSSNTGNGDLNNQFRFSYVTGSSGLNVATTTDYWGSTQGDINGDGYADIIIDGASGNDNLLVSNGNGTFSARSGLNVQTSTKTQSWSLGDLNGDGFLDTTQGTQVYLGTGLGTFTDGGTTGSDGDYVDIDGDGDLDIIKMKGTGTTVLLNNGSAVFTEVSMANTGLTGAISNYCFALVDVNNDGRVDIWRLPYNSAGNQVFLNNGNGSFTAQAPITSSVDTFLGAALVDYDNDGFVDLYVNRESGGAARIYHNNQDGTFTDVSSTVMSGITTHGARGGTTWLDFDGDGDLDIVSFETTDNVYRNNLKETGTATFTKVSNLTWTNVNLAANSALVTDFNYDGALDLIASRPGTNTSSLLKNNTAIAGWLDVHVGNSRGITQWGAIVELFDSITGQRVAVRHLVSGDYSSSQPDYVRFYGLDDSVHYDVRVTYGKDADGNANGTNVTKYVVTDGTAAYDVAGATMETNAAYNSINIGSGAGEVRSVYLTAEVGTNTNGSIQVGTALADAITGDAGNDTITGNGGNDIINLSAGGSDVVQYKLISTGGNGGNGLDTLLGFSTDILASGGDKIDLSGLLVAGTAPTISGNTASASDQLGRIKLDVSTGTAVLSVDYDGTAGTASAGYQQLLTFTTSSTDAQALLNQMVTQGNLFFYRDLIVNSSTSPIFARAAASNQPLNFVIDGNSIYRGNEPGSLASALSAYASSGDEVWSVGIGSQNWNAIANNHQDVDLSYRSGYQNILIVGEGNNHFYKTGYSVQSALDAVRQYITAVKAIHPEWQIILAGNLPAWEPDLSVSEHEIYNAQMHEWNDLAATQYSSLGADAFVDYRFPGSIFESDDRAILDQNATYWADRYVHPNAKGKTEMAQILTAGIGADISVSKTYEITFKFDEDPGLLSVWDGVTGNLRVQGGELSNVTGTGLIRTALFRPDFSTVLNKEFGTITYSKPFGDQIFSVDVINPERVTASRNKSTYAIGDSFQLSIAFNEDMVITQGAKIKLDLSGREVFADFNRYNSATKSAVFNCLVDSLDLLNSTSAIVSASDIYDNYHNPWLFKSFSISSTFIDASVF